MRGGKDEMKVTSPMFPRLHVNDTEKGGPRAPPRNKMALYEQLSIPSQRLGSGSASMLPLPSSSGSSLVPSTVIQQFCTCDHELSGGDHERSVFSQFCNSPAPPFLPEKIHSYGSSGIKRDTVMTNQEWKTMTPTNYQSLNTGGPLSSTAKSTSFKPGNFSNFRNFALKKFGDENDFRVPSSGQIQNEENAKFSQTSQDPEGKSTPIPLGRVRNLEDVSSRLVPKVKHSESLKKAHSSLNQENRSSIDILNGLHGTNARLHLESEALRDELALRDGILMETTRDMNKENSYKVRNESCLRLSPGDNNSSPHELENGGECLEEQNGRSVQVRQVDRRDDVSNTSMVDSSSALGISPDDVVGVIGEQEFWESEKSYHQVTKQVIWSFSDVCSICIVRSIFSPDLDIVTRFLSLKWGKAECQQRVFAVQVFELHRLMKVQKLIAKSPHLLFEDNLYIDKPSLNVPQVKRLRAEYDLQTTPRIVKAKDQSENPDLNAECADENAVANFAHSSVNNDTSKGLVNQRSNYLVNEATGSSNKEHQTISVVFSHPLEISGFVAPFYGSCGPMSLTPSSGDFLNTAYGIPASHHQGLGILLGSTPFGQTYFPPYGMPVMNPSVSGSVDKQMSPFPGARSKDDHFSMVDTNFMMPHQNSQNMSSQMSRAISRCFGKFQASKESEVQGSTASSPSERATGDALPLFPMEPIVQASDINAQTSEEQSRVIKVVPHNSRLATESAARIFQSIQEERKHYD
ncbi:hypothetical protein Patl1_33366 [Pistacia atlantica]|uniref:Uncharacterized protein n=1 Tax=Pistacia atlantica TaxID=434234 RepID=A0ACC0ZPM3_9ROSI|nr:hypothetical protein Patl1_33366 [Pistacia atlantica]